MSELPQTTDFINLLVNNTPLLDVRAPCEFAKGSLPGAINQPLINDEERHEIGYTYANDGQDAAIELGHELVKDEIKQKRVDSWQQYVQQHPNVVLFCWRGGMRSKISQQWLHDQSGTTIPRIEGGYKAVRQFLLQQLEEIPPKLQFFAIGGRTGSGKTRFLQQLRQPIIDLEGLALHRGSAFGPRATPQPTQVNFENSLATQLLQHWYHNRTTIYLEDEGRTIGSRHLPEPFYQILHNAPLLILQRSDEERLEITYQEYIFDTLQEFIGVYGDAITGMQRWIEYLHTSLAKIERRLGGGTRYKQLLTLMDNAISSHQQHNDPTKHKLWIEQLLFDYYDPMYDYQITKKSQPVLFRGSADEVEQFIQHQ